MKWILQAPTGSPSPVQTYAPMRPAWSPDSRCRARQPLTYASFEGRFTMSDLGYVKTHRTWEDWLGMLLGVVIVLSPWFPMQGDREIIDAERSFVILNTFTVGLLVFGLAQLEYVALQRWEEVAEIALGLWLIASPYIFGYSGGGLLRFWHSSLGGLVVLLAALQLWQDWDLSDQDLAMHGQSALT